MLIILCVCVCVLFRQIPLQVFEVLFKTEQFNLIEWTQQFVSNKRESSSWSVFVVLLLENLNLL